MSTVNTMTDKNIHENLSLTNQHVYKIRNFYRYLGLATGIGAFVLAFLFTAIKQNFHPSLNSIFIIFFMSLFLGIILTLTIYFSLRDLRLITSDEGILFYGQGGYRMYTPWNNIVGRTTWSTGRGSVQAIRLSQPAKEMSITVGVQQRQPAIEKRGWVPKMDTRHQTPTVIPVGYFMGDWQRSPLALDIKQHISL